VTIFLEAAGINKSNMPHDTILPINYVLTYNDLTITPDESSEIQEGYTIWIMNHALALGFPTSPFA
jgi:hypothetical protein